MDEDIYVILTGDIWAEVSVTSHTEEPHSSYCAVSICRLGVFESRMLKRLFGPKRNKMAGGWRELHDEELRNVYSSPSIFTVTKLRMLKLSENIVRMGKTKKAYMLLVGKAE
jgi:hypothetical protein